MSTVVHRQTLEIRESVNTPEYALSEWLIDAKIPEWPKRHWVRPITGDTIEQRSQELRDEADAEDLEEQKQNRITEIREQYNEALDSRYETRTLLYASYLLTKAMASMEEETVEYLSGLAQWVEDGDVLVEAAEELIESSTTVENVQAVSLTLTSWLDADPKVSTRAARKL
tara:strand:+ start:885 stop:1397 length:513 start_codon:yes stop_codon:yes gene_type:complete